MGTKRSLQKLLDQVTGWLPGFEPEGEEVALQPMATVQEIAIDGPVIELIESAVPQTDETETIGSTVLVNEPCAVTDDEPASDNQRRPWPVFVDALMASATDAIERIAQNLSIIKMLDSLKAAGGEITQQTRHDLLKFSGWGGLARLFASERCHSLSPQREQLESMLTPKAYASARSGVLTAYYTHSEVIRAMWAMVRRAGFTGGRFVEPAAGSGRFIACMPADIAEKSEITMVEPDDFSSQLLETTFQGLGVRVVNAEIEKAGLPHGFYDLAITNVPFGDFKSLETSKVPYAEFSLHNYFIAKAIDLVRPGGLVAVITSSYTMDADRVAHKMWINAQAELVMALRLPSDAFSHSGTEVVSDIMLFQRREAPAFSATNHWDELSQIGHLPNEHWAKVNRYYAQNPQRVLGKLVAGSNQFGKSVTVKAIEGVQGMLKDLNSMVEMVPQGIYKPDERSAADAIPSLCTVRATHTVKPGAFVLHNGRIHLSQDRLEWIDVDDAYKGKPRLRLLGMICIRDIIRKLIKLQLECDEDAPLKPLQNELNVRYDKFVGEFGNINDPANVRMFRNDPDCPLLLSLESYDEVKERYRKAAIFSKRTAGRTEIPERVTTVKDAMLISLGLYGRIVLSDMARRLAIRKSVVIRRLVEEQLAFEDPTDGQWLTADEYLSGCIRDKIATATAAGDRFRRNVVALTAVLPADLGPRDVEIRLGSTWVPTDVVADFAAMLLKLDDAERKRIDVSFNSDDTTWSFLLDGRPTKDMWFGNHGERTRVWGTDKRDAWDIMQAALNQVPPKVTYVVDGKSYVDQVATMAAREKYEAVKSKFKTWAYEDADRQNRLLRIYNDQFNQIVERRFDGSHLVLPGISKVVVPYSHQLDGVWRIITTGNTLLAHVVGAGKSLTMIAAAMELRRLGKARKPLIVVPNHLLYAFVGECMQFYPTAQILMASKEDLDPDKRREFAARVAVGDWDAVVMTHSAFEKLALHPQRQQSFIDEVLISIESMARVATDRSGSRGVKALEKKLKSVRSKLEKGLDAGSKDDLVTFEDLGCDTIMYDEAHALKNLMRISKMPNIAGLPNVSSKRALDAWMKFDWIMQQHGHAEKGVVLATGTPVSNSCSEWHVMMKYLMPKRLKALGIYEFDAWAANFGEAVTGMELSPDGSGYRLQTRFARFCNVPELMSVFRQVADIKTRSMVKLATPAVKGGKPTAVVCDPSAELLDFTAQLVDRAGKVRSRAVKPKEDNMLKITSEGRKAALDMRLVLAGLPADPAGKIAACVRESLRIWNETRSRKGTQLIFSDLGTPNGSAFSVYHAIRQGLLEGGVPASEIAFIHDHESDAAKAKLFQKVRAGLVRFLLGSTVKMGTGTNVQVLLKAVHSLDAPWRPSDIEQREGRGLRAGNSWEEIELLRYVVTRSFDSYIWQLLDVKASFIEQVMSNQSGARTVEDMSMGSLSYAEIKAIASGNPMVLEAATVSAELNRLSMLRRDWQDQVWRARNDIRACVEALAVTEARQPVAQALADAIAKETANGLRFTVQGGTGSVSAQLAEVIGETLWQTSQVTKQDGEYLVGVLSGVNVLFSRSVFGVGVHLEPVAGWTVDVVRAGVRLSDCERTGELVIEAVKALVNQPTVLAERVVELRQRIQDARTFEALPFEHADEIEKMSQRKAEIEASLDLAKDEAGTEVVVDGEPETAAEAS